LKARDFSFIEASELLGSNEEDAVTFGSGVGHFRIPGDGDPDAGGWEKALARREQLWLWLLSGWWLSGVVGTAMATVVTSPIIGPFTIIPLPVTRPFTMLRHPHLGFGLDSADLRYLSEDY
jgi:hypothetical protein